MDAPIKNFADFFHRVDHRRISPRKLPQSMNPIGEAIQVRIFIRISMRAFFFGNEG
jgi:hypothetical protein